MSPRLRNLMSLEVEGVAADWTKTTCPYCGVGCGVLAKPANKTCTLAEIKGDPDHPSNFGRLCSKGAALGETLSLDGRLRHPMIDGEQRCWDDALSLVAERFRETVDCHGPDSVALYVSGQILTEDYYVANKLMKGFIGSANIDTNSRLCMASSVTGHNRAFGSDTVPGNYEDLELADLVVLVGSNLAWCHPVLFQRLAVAREKRGTKIVVIDPRRTMTCEIADLHLAIAPGGDVALYNGLLAHLTVEGQVNDEYVAAHTSGFDAAVAVAAQLSEGELQSATGLSADECAKFYALFSANERVVTVYSQGVNQSSSGTDKVNAILNCHLATGRIGKLGCGPFSVTGQPNAMGGREVGGLANMLAAHMQLSNTEHGRIVQDFWQSPRIANRPGYKAVDLFRAVGDGRIKALWIMATNPVDSLPEADLVREAIAGCPFVVVSDVERHTDTTVLGHVLLPSQSWGEKSGTVTNSERRISRQRPFVPVMGEVKPDWWQICEVAKRMGYNEGFEYAGPASIFAEYAALTGAENDGSRDLDISAYEKVTVAEYDALAPFQWPQPAGGLPRETRFFADGDFFTPDKRAYLVATPFRAPASKTSEAFPLVLNTGRIRDQWHTMTRTAKTPRLLSHYAEPFVEIHPDDARASGLEAAQLAEIESRSGRVVMRVVVTDQQRRGTVFAPMHWTDQFANNARIDALISGHTDPQSGQPESKFTPVRVQPLNARWHGFAIVTSRVEIASFDYAAIAPIAGGFRLELAGCEVPASWVELADELLQPSGPLDGTAAATQVSNRVGPVIEVVAYHDRSAGQYRFAAFCDDRCVGLFFAARGSVEISRTWAVEQLDQAFEGAERLQLLAGRPGRDVPDRGRIICACFDVGLNQITEAIASGRCDSVAAVGDELKAGTNCGSCRVEIGRLLNEGCFAEAG